MTKLFQKGKENRTPAAKGIRKKRVSRVRPVFIAAGVIMLVYALSMLTPLYYMLVNSLKRIDDFLERGAWVFPSGQYGGIFWENYKNVFKMGGDTSFYKMLLNSLIFTVSVVLISTASTTATAYVLARFRFPGRGFLVSIGFGSLVLPDFGAASVIYKLFLDWNLMDTWGILIQFATPFGILYLMLFGLFSAMSNGYVEAAEIDGAGEFTIFFRICVPMAFGMMSAVMVITAINTWNDYYTSYMYLPSLKTLALGLQELSLTLSQFQRPTLFAAMVITVAPVVILFIAMHDKIISFTAGGGLKG